jgi:hypothetical protein
MRTRAPGRRDRNTGSTPRPVAVEQHACGNSSLEREEVGAGQQAERLGDSASSRELVEITALTLRKYESR